MNQIKIGKFIAECRKKANLTQLQLAEKLGITDKAISKWERGVAMPDTSIMLELCDILGISVNELLSGEKINMENNNQKNEQLLLDMAKELQNDLVFYVGNYDRKYDRPDCGYLYCCIFDSRRRVAACYNSWRLRRVFDNVLLCIKA